MSLKLICGPTGSGKTARAIEAFIRALDEGGNPVFIAPSVPDARHFEREILRNRAALSGAAVSTFNWLLSGAGGRSTGEKAVLSPLERYQILKEIIARRPPRTLAASSRFDGFVTDLADLISEMMTAGAEPAAFGQAMRGLAASDRWKQGLNQDLFRIFEEYRSLLAELNALDPDEAQRLAAAAIAADPEILGHRSIIIDGFWDFTPLQKSFIDSLTVSGIELLITLPYHPAYPVFAPVELAFARLREWAEVQILEADPGDRRHEALKHVSRHLFQAGAPAVLAGGAVATLKAAADRGQGELVAAEILRLNREGIELDDIAVVTRSYGSDTAGIAAALKDFGVPCETAAPVPLSATPVGETALAALRLALPGAEGADLLRFLRSPLAPAGRDQVDDFDRHARRLGIRQAPAMIDAWREFTGSAVPGIDRLITAAAAGVEPLAAALTDLMRGLFAASVSAATPDEIDLGARAMRELAAVSAATAKLAQKLTELEPRIGARPTGRPAGVWCQRLRDAVEQAAIWPASGSRRGCVRLLDPHRVLNQRFDVVFVCSLLEGRFPFLGGENAFLTDTDRAALGQGAALPLDGHENRLEEERFLFYRTLTRARHKVYLCYPYCDQEGKPTINSLLVDDVLDLLADDSWDKVEKRIGDVAFGTREAPTADQALLSLCLCSGRDAGDAAGSIPEELLAAARPAGLEARLARVADAARPRPPILSGEVRERLGALEHFRVTELESYLRCPFGYFLDYVIRAEPLDSDTFSLDRGLAVHEILAEFFAILKRGGVILARPKPGQIEEARRIMIGLIEEKFAPPYAGIEALVTKTHLLGHLDRFVEREQHCRPDYRPYQTEWSFGICDGSPGGRFDEETMLKFGDMMICGRMDRVDLRVGKTQAVVIDYKTSADTSLPNRTNFAEKGILQVPLYMLALRDIWGLEPVGGEYYGVLGKKRRGIYLQDHFRELGGDSGELVRTDFVDGEEFAACIEDARSRAIRAAAGIRSGEFPCSPLNGDICKYCGRQELCREAQPLDPDAEEW